MMYRIAFPLLALAVASGCSGKDATGPATAGVRSAISSSQDGGDDRHGALHLAKDCSEYRGQAGDHCTLVQSNVKEIPVGSKVFYLVRADLVKGTYNGDVELRVSSGNVAFGHCVVTDLFATIPTTVVGHCAFAGGGGRFKGFSAQIVVTFDGGNPALYGWNGTYDFSKNDDDD